MTRIVSVTSLLLLAAAQTFAAGPRVDIIIGEKAPALEKRAAEDIAFDLKRVYDAEVKIATTAPEGAENVIFVGSRETNEQTKKQIEANWPTLTKRDHVLRTIKYRGKSALFVGGPNPAAAYWAASEYAHSLGIRSLLAGDLYPVSPRPFTLEGYDTFLVLRHDAASHSEDDPFPTGFTSWSLRDYKTRLRQIARLKHNEIGMKLYSWQPFVDLQFDGVKKQTAVLWYGWQFPLGGDTAGRAAFKGAKLFENPDFAAKTTYQDRLDAGKEWLNGLIAEAKSFGISVDIKISPMEFPKEFAQILPRSKGTPEPADVAVRSLEERPSRIEHTRHEQLHAAAYKATYPEMGTLNFDNGSDLRFSFAWLVSNSDLDDYHLSRGRFIELLKDQACQELVTPICGEGVDASVFKAARQIYTAAKTLEKIDSQFNLPAPGMILKHYASSEPLPESWSVARENYLGAMNDMYRANSRAREGGRSYTLYLARRCEFGYEYMNCVEATRKAGIAKSKKDTAEQRAQLEKAIESMNAACSALAAVSRDQSDRGMIAVCNQFGYKALQKELEKLDEEEGK